MKPTRTQLFLRGPGQQTNIACLLLGLGIDVKAKGKSGGQPCERLDCPRRTRAYKALWKRPECDILDILKLARTNFTRRIKEAHPDNGGTNGGAAALIQLWKRIEQQFSRRGYALDV